MTVANTTPPGATWAGTHAFRAPVMVSARTVGDVQRLVAAGDPVRAIGTRHSFNDVADTSGTLVSVTQIPAEAVLDVDGQSVTVGAGTRYGELARWLEARGWALHNTGSLPHISIGGAIATGTHGSGDGNGGLATAVRALEYVDAQGELTTVRRGAPDFDGMVVGLGAYGIVVRVTLDVQPSFRVRQDVFTGLSWRVLLHDIEAVTGSAYSVSVFTDWQGAILGDVWRKTRLADGDDATPQVDDEWCGATRRHASVSQLVGGSDDNLTQQGGVGGPWSERLPHFRFEAVPSNGDEIQSEYFVPRTRAAEALSAVRALRDRITPLLLISELRTVAADELWLSGAYRRDTLCIHFTWRNRPDEVMHLLPDIERRLEPFGARPHWGKMHRMDAARLTHVFPQLADARRLFGLLDPRRHVLGTVPTPPRYHRRPTVTRSSRG